MTTVREWFAGQGRDRMLLRLLILLAGLATTGLTIAAAPGGDLAFVPYLVLAAIAAAAAPETWVTGVLSLLHCGVWWLFVPRPDSPAGLLLPAGAALLLLVMHLAASACGVWPPGVRVPAEARMRWARDAGLAAVGILVTAALGALVIAARAPGVAGATLAALAVIAMAAVMGFVRTTR